ncbi:TfoX/Sxy family DNA transformation protein [uncultured Oscillibacter sp.]|uniref:TfoX/Sxy family DNA transformation protein n=1 Tax=uncultured Oscillibacter sp. TaxID=876091 RepID=UPI0025D2450F|nr:TfoX/Sxy family DNA transformation protein [uncultured Oscillibacter sp.]
MDDLTSLPNIGPVLADHLRRVGIAAPADLRAAGAREAFLRIRAQVDPDACFHQLTALAGAELGIPKKDLTPADRQALRDFFSALKTN